MHKSSSQKPDLVGSVVSNDCSVKRADVCPSKHNHAGRGAKGQSSSSMPKVGCKKFTSCTAREDGNKNSWVGGSDTIKNESYPGGSRKNIFNSTSLPIDGWNKSVIWPRKENDNTKGEDVEWPSWGTASNQNSEHYTRPSKHNQDGRGAKGQASSSMPKVGCKKFTNCTAQEDGNADLSMVSGGSKKGIFNSTSPHIDGWNKSVICVRKENYNTKGEVSGWPSWGTASNHKCEQYSRPASTCEDYATMACKRGSNESEDGKANREIGEAFDHDGLNGWKQSSLNIHMVDKGGLSKSAYRDAPEDGNVKRETGQWPRSPGDMSKTIGCKRTASNQNSEQYTRPSKHNQAGRGAKGQSSSSMPKVSCKKFTRYTTQEDVNADLSMVPGGSKKGIFNSTSPHIDGWNKSVIWVKKENDNTKGQASGWPSWGTASNQKCEQYNRPTSTCEDDATMECKRGSNESEDGRANREIGEAFDHDGLNGWKQSRLNIHMVDKGGLSKSAYWDAPENGNVKSETGQWPRSPGDMPKTIGQYSSRKNRKGGCNQSCVWTTSDDCSSMARNQSEVRKENREIAEGGDTFDHDGLDGWKQSSSNIHIVDNGSLRKSACWDVLEDDNGKMENDGWPQWPGAISKTIGQFPSRKSRGWPASDDGDSRMENGGRNPDLYLSADPRMEHGPMMSPKCDRNKSAGRAESGRDGFDRDHRRWDMGIDQTGCDSWKQLSPTELPKIGRRKFRDEGKNSLREKMKRSVAAPEFGVLDALKQNSTSPKVWGKKLSRNRSETPFNVLEHGPFSERDREEFRDSKKARYLGHDRCTSVEDPWKQMDHLLDRLSQRHGNHSNGTEKNKLFRNDLSCDGSRERCIHHHDNGRCPVKNESEESCHDKRAYVPRFGRRADLHGEKNGFMLEKKGSDDKGDHKNTDKVSSWNDPKICKATLCDPLIQSHLTREDEGFRDETIKPMVTTPKKNANQDSPISPHVWKSQQKPYICHQSPKNLGSPTNTQNEHITSSPIQFGENMQVGPQLPSRTESSNSNGHSHQLLLQHGLNRKDEVQSREQHAILNAGSFKKNDNIRDISTTQDLNVLSFTTLSSLQPFSSTVHVTSSDPVDTACAQANEDSSSSNLRSGFSPGSIEQKASITRKELNSSKKRAPVCVTVAPSDTNLNTSTHFVRRLQNEKQEAKQTGEIADSSRIFTEKVICQNSKSLNVCHSEPVDVQVNGESNSSKYEKVVGANGEGKGGIDDKGILKFKFALAEFVKEIIKPIWKEGRLSKEAHKTVVKKVVDKVTGVLGPNIPQTQERIDLYLSYSKDKLGKLVQDYLEMFINT